MATQLRAFHRRLRRAKKHLNEFTRTANRFTKASPCEVVSETDTDGSNQILHYKASRVKEPPPRLSLIAGDCIHNLRSVLDNLIWQLAKNSGCSNRKLDDPQLHFPVYKDPQQFNQWKTKFNCLPQAAINLLEDIQPYQPYKQRVDPDSHPLRILHDLWNNDKHVSPALMLAAVKSSGLKGPRFTIGQMAQSKPFIFRQGPIKLHGGRIINGKELATVSLTIGESEPGFVPQFAFGIAFDEKGVAKVRFVSEYLSEIHDFIRDKVLIPFECIFSK